MIYSATKYKCYEELNKKFKILLDYTKMKAPFVNKEIYESFNIFVQKLKDILDIRLKLEIEGDKRARVNIMKEKTLEENYLNEALTLNQNLEILTNKLRDYLNSLRVYQ